MKVKGKELILKIVSLVATVLSFVGLAFKFAVMNTDPAIGKSTSSSQSLQDWVDSFKLFKNVQETAVRFWQVARVFLIIALVVLAVLALITIVQFFFNHKYLSLAKLVVSIAAVACFVVFFALLVIGGIMLGNKMSSDLGTVTFLPNVGAWFIFLFGLVAGVVALVDRKKA